MFEKILRGLEIALALFFIAAILGYSNPSITDEVERIRVYTRDSEFNYVSWMGNAALIKLRAASVDIPYSLDRETQKQIVTEYLRVIQTILDKENLLAKLYADPSIANKEQASQSLRSDLEDLYKRQTEVAPFAEAILQDQVEQVLAEIGLTTIGQSVPNVWYHSTPLPMALIVSPRDRIEQTANISLETDITLDEQAALETRVDKGLNTSSLVVPIGGVGVYPTMVMRTTDLNWLLSTVAHEWIHNYLTMRPLGFLYTESPELRTMNETTASIAGDEIGAQVIDQFYPELKSASFSTLNLISAPFDHPEPGDFLRPPFDYRAEMHDTRVNVDAMLADGKIEAAEAYMEQRRGIFLSHGYLLRKLNQAYFAFYGAYADVPGGAAGQDPVGPAVRQLRAQSASLADFVNTIAWMTSFNDLLKATQK